VSQHYGQPQGIFKIDNQDRVIHTMNLAAFDLRLLLVSTLLADATTSAIAAR
jgi:hypothetical protein